MKHIVHSIAATSILFWLGSVAQATPEGGRPNIVFILADDMGWAQPGFNGGKAELTPNLDKRASEGMRKNEFYTHSVCAPTRAAFLTGRYAFRTWSDWRSEDFGKPSYLAKLGLTLAYNKRGEPTRRIHALDSEERTIAEALRDAGCFTSLIGKWHLGEWLPQHLPRASNISMATTPGVSTTTQKPSFTTPRLDLLFMTGIAIRSRFRKTASFRSRRNQRIAGCVERLC